MWYRAYTPTNNSSTLLYRKFLGAAHNNIDKGGPDRQRLTPNPMCYENLSERLDWEEPNKPGAEERRSRDSAYHRTLLQQEAVDWRRKRKVRDQSYPHWDPRHLLHWARLPPCVAAAVGIWLGEGPHTSVGETASAVGGRGGGGGVGLGAAGIHCLLLLLLHFHRLPWGVSCHRSKAVGEEKNSLGRSAKTEGLLSYRCYKDTP